MSHSPNEGRVARCSKYTLQMSKTPNVGRATQGFVFALITIIYICFKMTYFWFNIWWRSQKEYKKYPNRDK